MSRMPEVGDVVDDVFRVESELDHGNFGAIYRVHDIVEDRTLALKIQKPGPHDEQEVRQRFEREARLIYSLDHDHVVEVMYYGETRDDLPYMAMEFLDGTDLKRLVRSGVDLNDDQIKRISLETLSALDAAHEVGIVHRDLKPANIFLVDDGNRGHVKVLDFGFAKSQDDQQNRQLTRAGTLVGTPAYMAPEMVHKEDVGAHSDLYGMGLIMAEMVTGEKVVQIENVYDTIVYQGSEKPVELPDAVQESRFHAVIEKAVQKDLRRRYQSAEAMMEDLRRIGRDGEAADLQRHAEVEEPSSPYADGAADSDVATQPRSRGMPSEERVDREVGASHTTGPQPAAGRAQSQSGRSSTGAVNTGQSGGQSSERRSTGPADPVASQTANSPSSTGPVDPVDPQGDAAPRSTGPVDVVDPNPTDDRAIDDERPPHAQRQTGGSSLLTEIFLGLLLGSVGVVIILFVVMYLYPIR